MALKGLKPQKFANSRGRTVTTIYGPVGTSKTRFAGNTDDSINIAYITFDINGMTTIESMIDEGIATNLYIYPMDGNSSSEKLMEFKNLTEVKGGDIFEQQKARIDWAKNGRKGEKQGFDIIVIDGLTFFINEMTEFFTQKEIDKNTESKSIKWNVRDTIVAKFKEKIFDVIAKDRSAAHVLLIFNEYIREDKNGGKFAELDCAQIDAVARGAVNSSDFVLYFEKDKVSEAKLSEKPELKGFDGFKASPSINNTHGKARIRIPKIGTNESVITLSEMLKSINRI